MHNYAFREQGLDYEYSLKEVPPDRLKDAVESLREPDVIGANVTIPHKKKITGYLDEVTPEAGNIGAVNTVFKKKETLIGTNTDASGGIRALKEVYEDLGRAIVLILGAGGASRALSYKLAPNVSELTILNRTGSKALDLAEYLTEKTGVQVIGGGLEELEKRIKETDILINATPVGMNTNKQSSPVPSEVLHSDLLVYDLVYNPVKTKLLKEAEKKGCKVLSGVKMLVYQGALAYEIWTGRQPPVEEMIAVVEEALGGNSV
jgi:shikimate dehydrogenase